MVFAQPSTRRKLLTLLTVIVLLYIFVCGIKLMGGGCKAMKDHDLVRQLIEQAHNPFIALLVGIVVTSVIQSSSTTTSIVVAMDAAEMLTVVNAIPIVMGANIGTTVTNTIVSFGYAGRKQEFERSFGASIVQRDRHRLDLAVNAGETELGVLFGAEDKGEAPPLGMG